MRLSFGLLRTHSGGLRLRQSSSLRRALAHFWLRRNVDSSLDLRRLILNRRPTTFWLRLRLHALLLLRATNHLLRLAPHLHLLLLGCTPLLLICDRLLPRSFALRLLLLNLLTHALTLRLLCVYTLSALLLDLLSAKVHHLLPSISIASRCLSGEIRDLFLASLFRSQLS